MAQGRFVDIDLYGRGFDGVFGSGSEVESRRQTVMKFQAMKRFQERVKPGEYVDLDLYGRGDPRIFGPGAHIETQKKSQSRLEETQQTKTSRKLNLRAVVFPSGIKAIAKKARAVIRRISSKTDESESDIQAGSGDTTDEYEESLANNAVEDTTVKSQGEGKRISEGESSPVDDSSRNVEATDMATDEKKAPFEDKGPKEDSVADPASKTEEIDDSATVSDIDRAPRRFKSRLPSEEVRPEVEKGHVARAVKSFSSFDRSDEQTKFTSNIGTGDLSRLAAFSSLPIRRTSGPEVPESSSNRGANTGYLQNNERNDVSITEQVAKRVLDGSDEELQLSFSSPPQNPVTHQSTDNSSTSSDEDLITTNTQSDQTVLDEAGRSVLVGNKITGLFRSGDSGFDSDTGGIENSRVPRGSDKPSEKSSSTDDEKFSENIAPSTGISKDDEQLGVEEYMAIQQDGDEEPESVMDSRGTSIIQVVETPRLTSQELIEEALLQRYEDEELEMEATLASTSDMETVQPAINETTEYSAAEILDLLEETPDSAMYETTEYSAAEIVDVGDATLNTSANETTEYSAAEIVDFGDATMNTSANETTEYSAAEIVDTVEETLQPAMTETIHHSVAEVVEGITEAEELASLETTEQSTANVVDKGNSSRKTSSTADYEEEGSIETAGNEQSSESIEDSDRSQDASSSSEVMTSSPEEDSDDVDTAEVDSSELEEEMEEGENVVEVENAEEAEDNSVLVVESIETNLNSQNDTEDVGNREDVDEPKSDSGNDADVADQDGANNNKTFWQRLGLFNVVMTSSRIVF